MKLAICAQGEGLTSPVDQRFGRCPYFVIVDPDRGEIIKSIPNSGLSASGGAGTQSARLLLAEKVDAVAVGNIGPNAATAFKGAGINVYGGIEGTVEETLNRYSQGKLTLISEATVNSHFSSKQ